MKRPAATPKRRKAAKATQPKRRPSPTRHRSVQGEETRVRVTVAVLPSELAWLEGEAQKRQLSVSATFSEVLRFGMLDAAWERSFAAAGGVPSLTDEQRAEIDAEFREAGLIT